MPLQPATDHDPDGGHRFLITADGGSVCSGCNLNRWLWLSGIDTRHCTVRDAQPAIRGRVTVEQVAAEQDEGKQQRLACLYVLGELGNWDDVVARARLLRKYDTDVDFHATVGQAARYLVQTLRPCTLRTDLLEAIEVGRTHDCSAYDMNNLERLVREHAERH